MGGAKQTDPHSAEGSGVELSGVSGKRGIGKCVFVYDEKFVCGGNLVCGGYSSELYCWMTV
jgi:hypothetical protein